MTKYFAKQSPVALEHTPTLLELKRLSQQLEAKSELKERQIRKQLATRLAKARATLLQRRRKVHQEMRQITESSAQLLLPKIEQEVFNSIEQECVGLCFRVVKEFLKKRLPKDEAFLTNQIRKALLHLHTETPATLFLHPEQRSIVDTLELDQHFQLTLSFDEEIPKGKAKLKTQKGLLEFDWENHLERFAFQYMTHYAQERAQTRSEQHEVA